MRSCVIIVSTLFAAAGTASFATPPLRAAANNFPAPLANRIPADAEAYFGWAGPVSKWPGYRTSNLRIVLSHTHIADFVQGNLPVALRRLNDLPAARNAQLNMAEFKKAFAIGALLMTHPFALYFRSIRSGIRNVASLPQPVLVINAGKYPAAVLAIFKNLPHRLYPTGPRIEVGAVDSMVYAGIHITSGVRKALAKQGKTLSTSATFCRTMRFMPANPIDAEFADLTRLRKYANGLLDQALRHSAPRRTPMGKQQRIIINSAKIILNGQSLGNDTAFASAAGFSGRQWINASFLAMHNSSVKARSGAADMLALAPEDSPDVSVSHLNLGAFVSTLKTYLEATSPRVRRSVRQALTMVNGITGVNVEKDLINSFGPYWLTYQSTAMPMSSGLGTVIVNRPSHPVRLARALQTLTPMALLAVNAAMRQRGYTGVPAQLRILHANGAVIYYIKANGIMPAWAMFHGCLYVSAYPRPIQLALKHKAGAPSILDNRKFLALQKHLGCSHNYTNATYTDAPRILPAAYSMLTTQAAAYSLLLGLQFNPPVSALIPRLSDLQKATTVSGSVTWTDKAGWHSRGISGYPGSGMFVP
jgi:hypothetical protein